MNLGRKATLIQFPLFVSLFATPFFLLWRNGTLYVTQDLLFWASVAGLASVGDQAITDSLVLKYGNEFLEVEWNVFIRLAGRFGKKWLFVASVVIISWAVIFSVVFGIVIAQFLALCLTFCVAWNTISWYIIPRLSSTKDEAIQDQMNRP